VVLLPGAGHISGRAYSFEAYAIQCSYLGHETVLIPFISKEDGDRILRLIRGNEALGKSLLSDWRALSSNDG
jgi:hypothetical protein